MNTIEQKHQDVFSRLEELIGLATKESLTKACKILSIPKKEAEDLDKRIERISFASEVFNRVPKGCLWRRKADEVKSIARAVGLKARGKKVGIQAIETWHKSVISGFVKARETTLYKKEMLALYKQGLPMPLELVLNSCQGSESKMLGGYCYQQGDVAFDHAKGRDHVWHASMRTEEELEELNRFGFIIDNPFDYIANKGLDSSSEFMAYKYREEGVSNYEMATSLLSKEFDVVLSVLPGLPKDVVNKRKNKTYFDQMAWNLYFSVSELRTGKFQGSLF